MEISSLDKSKYQNKRNFGKYCAMFTRDIQKNTIFREKKFHKLIHQLIYDFFVYVS